GAADRAGAAVHRGDGRGAPQSRDRAYLPLLRCRREEVDPRPSGCGRGTRRHPPRCRSRGCGHHADDHRRRRLVAPRARSRLRSRLRRHYLQGHHAPYVARPSTARARGQSPPGKEEAPMKGSRITAVGLVAAAALWIASGHFMPHESAESRAAIQPAEDEAKKLFRIAVMPTNGEQLSLRLTLSGRTGAEKRGTV